MRRYATVIFGIEVATCNYKIILNLQNSIQNVTNKNTVIGIHLWQSDQRE